MNHSPEPESPIDTASPVSLAQATLTRLVSAGAVLPLSALEIIESALIRTRISSVTEVKLETDMLLDSMESQSERRFDSLVRCAVGATLLSLNETRVAIKPATMTQMVGDFDIRVNLDSEGAIVYDLEARNVG